MCVGGSEGCNVGNNEDLNACTKTKGRQIYVDVLLLIEKEKNSHV
jgi:hypothetical protein